MPTFNDYLLKDPEDVHSTEGTEQIWNLPWEWLVFDQRFEYQPKGADAKGLYKIKDIRETAKGTVYDVVLDPGNLKGGDPKKERPPYSTH